MRAGAPIVKGLSPSTLTILMALAQLVGLACGSDDGNGSAAGPGTAAEGGIAGDAGGTSGGGGEGGPRECGGADGAAPDSSASPDAGGDDSGWDERPSGGSDDVTVDLTTPRASVRVYDPTAGTSPTRTLAGVSSVGLTLSDHPMVIAL